MGCQKGDKKLADLFRALPNSTMFQCSRGTALVLGAFLLGFGFVALSNLPVANYGKNRVTADPVIDMAAGPLTAWRPTSALKPTTRMQSLRAQPPVSRNDLELSKNVVRALEKKEKMELPPAVEKNMIRDIAPAVAAAASIAHIHPAHAGQIDKIVGVAALMPVLVFLGVVGGLVLLKIEQLFPDGFAKDGL